MKPATCNNCKHFDYQAYGFGHCLHPIENEEIDPEVACIIMNYTQTCEHHEPRKIVFYPRDEL